MPESRITVILILMLCTSGFVQASTTNVNAPPAVTITSPENDSTFTVGSNIIITATASDTDGAISSVSFYNGSTLLGQSSKFPYIYIWEKVPAGTYTLTAQATAEGVSSTSSPITVTVTTASPLPPEVEITTPANNTTFTAGSEIRLAAFASEANGTISTVSFYSGSTLLTTINMISSYCNYTWKNVPAGTYSLTAVATDTNNVSTTSKPITVRVSSSSNSEIAITGPADQSTFIAGSNITIDASASENNGTITEVFFYGTDYLGSSTVSPYMFTWKDVPAGTYSLTAEATDSNGGTLISPPVHIAVTAPQPVPPAVNITRPVNHSTMTAGSSLSITADASETDGTIAKVSFYNGTTLLGTSTKSPYTYTWKNVPVGTCTLTAKATDANGVSTASSQVKVMVIKNNGPT